MPCTPQLCLQSVSGQRLEMLKLQLQDEVELPFREKFSRLDEEVEKYRSEYNKLKYEYAFLKSEYDHDRQEHQRVVEEMSLRHEAEVSLSTTMSMTMRDRSTSVRWRKCPSDTRQRLV